MAIGPQGRIVKQLVLDMGLSDGPSLQNYCPGPNTQAVAHLQHWLASRQPGTANAIQMDAAPQSPPCLPLRLPSRLPPVPTYLWGDTGMGKTHLLRALQISLHTDGAATGWLDAQAQPADEFQEHWAAVLMDDVHALDAAQQHVAFQWLIHAQTHGIPVVAAGALPPADLPLRDDLRSRLGWGDVFGLQPLGDAQRRTVLSQAAHMRGVHLSAEVLDFMLSRFSRDMGNLMALLDRMDGYALQTHRTVTVALIKSMLDEPEPALMHETYFV